MLTFFPPSGLDLKSFINLNHFWKNTFNFSSFMPSSTKTSLNYFIDVFGSFSSVYAPGQEHLEKLQTMTLINYPANFFPSLKPCRLNLGCSFADESICPGWMDVL